MNQYLLASLYGLGVGLAVGVIVTGLYSLIANTLQRRDIKKKLFRGEFIQPLVKKDYNTKIWGHYFDVEANQKQFENINEQIYKKGAKSQ